MMGGGGPRSGAIAGGGGQRFSGGNWSGRNWSGGNWRRNGRFDNRFHNRFRGGAFAFGFAPYGYGYYDDYDYYDPYAYAYADDCPVERVRYVRNGRVFYRNVQRCY